MSINTAFKVDIAKSRSPHVRALIALVTSVFAAIVPTLIFSILSPVNAQGYTGLMQWWSGVYWVTWLLPLFIGLCWLLMGPRIKRLSLLMLLAIGMMFLSCAITAIAFYSYLIMLPEQIAA